MKTTGIVRRVDNLGRIVLPAEMRRLLDIDKSDVEIFVDGDQVLLRKHSPRCVFCGYKDSLTPCPGKNICAACITKFKRMK